MVGFFRVTLSTISQKPPCHYSQLLGLPNFLWLYRPLVRRIVWKQRRDVFAQKLSKMIWRCLHWWPGAERDDIE